MIESTGLVFETQVAVPSLLTVGACPGTRQLP
jgi:hypothetical protein